MSYPIADEYEHEGIDVKLIYDETPGNPYKEWDQATELVVSHRLSREYDFGAEVNGDLDEYASSTMQRWFTLFWDCKRAVPFHILDYGSGGTVARLIEPSDDHADGFVLLKQEGIDRTGVPENAYDDVVKGEFKTFAHYVEGEVFGYIVAENSPEEDSCWGYYGMDDVKEAANEAAGYAAQDRAERLHKLRYYRLDPTAPYPITQGG
jgi:hypothetical protein